MNHERIKAVIEWATEAAAEHVQLAVFKDEEPSPHYGQGLWQSFEHNFPNRGEDCDVLSTILSATYSATVKALTDALPQSIEIFELYSMVGGDVPRWREETLGWYATEKEAQKASEGLDAESFGIGAVRALKLIDDSMYVVQNGKPVTIKRFGRV